MKRLSHLQLLILLGMFAIAGCREPARQRPAVANAQDSDGQTGQQENGFLVRTRPQAEKFCADCHAMPRPESSPRDEWQEEVEQGFALYHESGRTDLSVPDAADIQIFFQYQAPNELVLTRGITGYPPTELPLVQSTVRVPSQRPPVVTNVRWVDFGADRPPALVYCDIATGQVKAHWPREQPTVSKRLATLLQPVHVEPCDLDQDGQVDLVVADIGEFNANESDLGQVVWLRNTGEEKSFERIVLLDGLSRLADVRPGDFDQDGDIDLLVAAFGWRKTGRVFLMVNDGVSDQGTPNFSVRDIDQRNGPVSVPTVDLNNDGNLDFIVAISQEHEVVEAFINDGTGRFSNHVLWSAPDPAYGSSGIDLVDMDGDDDLDVLYVNGDSFDRGAKTHHSVQWLENPGSFPFVHHHLLNMPGVMAAKAADFDADGDVDVVATTLLAGHSRDQVNAVDSSSIVILQQDSPGIFKPTRVESRLPQHLTLETGDFDANGSIDFAVGNFLRGEKPTSPDLTIWWNGR